MKNSTVIFLLTLTTLLQAQAANAEDVTTCKNAWQNSPAYESCNQEDIFSAGNAGVITVVRIKAEGSCLITASCKMTNGGNFVSSATGSAATIKTLNNCNGILKATSC